MGSDEPRSYVANTRDEPPPAAPTDASAGSAPALGPTARLLLAEDQPAVRRVTRAVLELAGYQVVTVSDGLEAVTAFAAAPDSFALVILDAVMPRLDARGAFERIVALRPDQRVLFVSGYADGGADDDLIDRRRRWFLAKPWFDDALVVAVRQALDAP